MSDACQTNGVEAVSLRQRSAVASALLGLTCGAGRGSIAAEERVTLRLGRIQLEQLDLLVTLGEFDDRSSAIRQAIRELVDSRRAKAIEKAAEVAKLQDLAATATRADEVLRK